MVFRFSLHISQNKIWTQVLRLPQGQPVQPEVGLLSPAMGQQLLVELLLVRGLMPELIQVVEW